MNPYELLFTLHFCYANYLTSIIIYKYEYTIMDLLPVEYAVLLTRKSDIGRGKATGTGN
jgi:hypothetical protein